LSSLDWNEPALDPPVPTDEDEEPWPAEVPPVPMLDEEPTPEPLLPAAEPPVPSEELELP